MKKVLTFVLTIALVLASMSTTTAFAAENVNTESSVSAIAETTVTLRSSTNNTGTMIGGSTVFSVPLYNVGTSPTFTFYISGNPDLYVDVEAVSPLGGTFTAFSNICCDGSSHSSYHFSLATGTYYFTIRVNHGVSGGQVKPFTISASW